MPEFMTEIIIKQGIKYESDGNFKINSSETGQIERTSVH